MTSAVPDSPAFPSYQYFDRPPVWTRNLVAAVAGVLAFVGFSSLVVGQRAESRVKFVEVGERAPEVATDPATGMAAPPVGFFANDIFTAQFPSEPETATQSKTVAGRTIDLTMYLVDQGDIAYMVATTALPPGAAFDFQAGAEGAIRSAKGTLEIARRTTFSDYPAMDVKGKVEDGTMRVMIVKTPTHMVQVMVLGVGDPAKQYQHFIDHVTVR